MTEAVTLHGLGWEGIGQLVAHFALLSILSVGGAIATAPDMHRYLVAEQHWLTDTEFAASIAIAQAAPGPNILFVALMGWHAAGLAGAAATMIGIMGPSSMLALTIGRWRERRGDALVVRAFTAGFTPLTLGLLCATAWLLTGPTRDHPGTIVLVGATVVTMTRTKLNPLWLLGAGAGLGAMGLA